MSQPLQIVPTSRPQDGRLEPTTPVPPGLQVLVVDDDPLTRMLMSRMLTRLGCHVSTAENGDIALDMLLGSSESGSIGVGGIGSAPGGAARPPSEDTPYGIQFACERGERAALYSVVFLDNQMPVMSGLTVIAKLREMGRQDFVVGVTGGVL
jgi:osomolarity two-component system, sensor histidine kinase SLN1